jgi:hypothetical protein
MLSQLSIFLVLFGVIQHKKSARNTVEHLCGEWNSAQRTLYICCVSSVFCETV